VRQVISDAHEGLEDAIASTLQPLALLGDTEN